MKKKLLDKDELYKYSIKLIKRKPYFIHEIESKLKTKAEKYKDVYIVINKLITNDYLNDKKTTRIYINNLINIKRCSKKQLYLFFDKYNISKNLINNVLTLFYSEDVFYKNYLYHMNLLKSKNKNINYIYNYLYSRGFDEFIEWKKDTIMYLF